MVTPWHLLRVHYGKFGALLILCLVILSPYSQQCLRKLSCCCRQIDAVSQGLTALEHASFACPSNEQHLVGLQMQPHLQQLTPAAIAPVSQDGRPQPNGMPFPAWLVQLISQAARITQSALADGQHVSAGIADHSSRQWGCMQAGLSVLINMTHHNAAGCDAVMDAGGLHLAANMLSSSLEPNKLDDCLADGSASQEESIARDRQHALAHVGTLTAALGLLINLLENSEENKKQLKEMQFADSSSGSLQILCRLMQASMYCDHDPTPGMILHFCTTSCVCLLLS